MVGRWDNGSDDEDEWSWMNFQDEVTVKKVEADGCSSQEENSLQDGGSSQEENSPQERGSSQEENSRQYDVSSQEENSEDEGLAVEDLVPRDSDDEDEQSTPSKQSFYCKLNRWGMPFVTNLMPSSLSCPASSPSDVPSQTSLVADLTSLSCPTSLSSSSPVDESSFPSKLADHSSPSPASSPILESSKSHDSQPSSFTVLGVEGTTSESCHRPPQPSFRDRSKVDYAEPPNYVERPEVHELRQLGSRTTLSLTEQEMTLLMTMMDENGTHHVNTAEDSSDTVRDRLLKKLREKIKEKRVVVKTLNDSDERLRSLALLDSGASHLMGPAKDGDYLKEIYINLAGNNRVKGRMSQFSEVESSELIIPLGKCIRLLGLDLRWNRSGLSLWNKGKKLEISLVGDLPHVPYDVYNRLRMKLRRCAKNGCRFRRQQKFPWKSIADVVILL